MRGDLKQSNIFPILLVVGCFLMCCIYNLFRTVWQNVPVISLICLAEKGCGFQKVI